MLRNLPAWRASKRFLFLGCSTSTLCWTSLAMAQAEATQPAAGEPVVEEVVVTGSLLTSENGFQAPTPVSVLNEAALKSAAPDNLADALNQLPQFHGSTRSNQGGGGGASGGTNGQNLLNLRGLGPERNLVLLDGRRLPPSNASGSVNINVIPDALISRVDVVTGGASAAYGSDAVAGVVNFVLDSHFTGVKLDASTGISTYGDGATGKVSAAFGTDLMDGRFRIVGSGSWFHQDGLPVTEKTGRDWFDNPYGRYACKVADCGYSNFIGRNPQSSTGSAGGTITAINSAQGTVGSVIRTGPLATLQFGPGGELNPFPLGTDIGSQYMIGGGSGISLNNALSPTQTRYNFFVHSEFDVNDRLSAYLEGLYSKDDSLAIGLLNQTLNSQGQFTIYGDNAYLPDSVKALLPASQVGQNVPVFGLSRINVDLPAGRNLNITTLKRVSGGVKGSLSDRWRYNASLTYSKSFQNLTQYNMYNVRNIYAAADAIMGPNGQIVCRSNLTGGNPGCVPVNFFGPDSISPAGVDYVSSKRNQNASYLHIDQTVIDLNVSGDLGDNFQLGAGPISVAMGLSGRREEYNRETDPLSASVMDVSGIQGVPATYSFPGRLGAFTFYNPQPSTGTTTAKEAFVEIGVPLLRDVALAKQLDLNAAIRETDYNLSGRVASWKTGLSWQVVDSLRLRGTYSQDIRAPNAGELFNAGSQVQNNQLYPCAACANSFTRPTINLAVGNPDLDPEIARTLTLGAVVQPEFIPGLSFSVDYYNIKVKDFIASAAVAQDACWAGSVADCARITINGVPISNINEVTPTTVGLQILTPNANVAERKVEGLDFEGSYSLPLSEGRLTARAFANFVLHDITSNASFPDAVGTIGSPHWSSELSLRYDINRFGMFVQERLIGPVTNNPALDVGINVNCCNSTQTYYYTDATLTYKFAALQGDHELFLTVANVFNRDPPIAPGNATNYVSNTNYGDYDALGRRFTLGVRMKF
ncbi:MAG TPA: TonB-dependent receptor [Steroidobacteraceae bacterium]